VNNISTGNKRRIMVVVESVSEASELVKKGLMVKEVNVGGIGYREGTREVAPYIYLSTLDIESVVYLHDRGVRVTGKQLPNSAAVDIVKKLAGIK
jgi:mannose/fructose/N-acetylgalactosamine-specific phosphotransferase system component IIB